MNGKTNYPDKSLVELARITRPSEAIGSEEEEAEKYKLIKEFMQTTNECSSPLIKKDDTYLKIRASATYPASPMPLISSSTTALSANMVQVFSQAKKANSESNMQSTPTKS